ncbi:ubiquinone biosynthesis accessory factor UbiK [Xanthomonas populi]|uniref:ubiquinone biosynthesis accessory factor UbiK n=1 Tax=Xanthomonas populi TaxID=53414 RepID=UPI001FCA18A5|nr:accessory factor UbiK family protein [Xanthomonas populi]
MIDFNKLDDLARRLSDLVPPGLRQSREELQSTFKGALQAGLGKLDLVTREEFDVQRAVLLRTREKLDALEQAVAALDARPPAAPPPRSLIWAFHHESGTGAQPCPRGGACA